MGSPLLATALALLVMQSSAAPPATASPENLLKSLGLDASSPASQAEIEAARREADAIATGSQASAFFENVTTTANPALKHKASGLVCTFNPHSPINHILLFRPPSGDSFGCNTSRDTRSFSVFLDRAPPSRPPIEQLIGPLANAIVRRFPDAKSSGPVIVASGKSDKGEPLPTHKVAQFTRMTPSGDVEERLAAGYAGGWFLQTRVTEPASDSTTADLLNEFNFLAYQRALLGAGSAGGTAAAP